MGMTGFDSVEEDEGEIAEANKWQINQHVYATAESSRINGRG